LTDHKFVYPQIVWLLIWIIRRNTCEIWIWWRSGQFTDKPACVLVSSL